jgi:hypothetical protein
VGNREIEIVSQNLKAEHGSCPRLTLEGFQPSNPVNQDGK